MSIHVMSQFTTQTPAGKITLSKVAFQNKQIIVINIVITLLRAFSLFQHHHHVVGGVGRGLCVDVSRVHDFHGNAANQSLNGTLRHADINQVLSHRAQEKIVKYRAGYAALDVRRAFIPAVVSTSGRIHGDLLRLLYLLADNKTKRHFRDRHEAIDDDSEAYCWRRSGFFWRMRASFGLACAQATTLAAQVFGKGNPRSRAGRTSA